VTATALQADLQMENARLRERVEQLEWAVGVYRNQLATADQAYADLIDHQTPEWAT
jgi:hypothetical protein